MEFSTSFITGSFRIPVSRRGGPASAVHQGTATACEPRRLGECAPMKVGPRAEGDEVVQISENESRLRESIPARLEVTRLREPGPAPFRVYVTDDWDSDFQGSAGTPFADWASAEHAAKAG